MTESDCSIDSSKTPRLQPSLTKKGIGNAVVTLHDYARTGSCRRLPYDGNNQKYVAISGTPHLVNTNVWRTCDRWYVHVSSRRGCLRCGFVERSILSCLQLKYLPEERQITLSLLKNKS
ncbi:hypothetical protein ALC62_02351 [Cyphomyrmex costatus]|uniref:Uncharacterized protein n=1 Tax=Cyphomyrmex costatus TaxID=456900 RepID=A0A195D1A9_9HYME|nr:hypothetical protein ALC62_02351 [Cyphomyrmex costatus]